jgi:hypothetical protein
MKKISAMCLVAAAVFALFTTEPADAAMYVDSEERRSAMFTTFVLVLLASGGLCLAMALMTRTTDSFPELEPSSEFVPQIKQESNIVERLVTA